MQLSIVLSTENMVRSDAISILHINQKGSCSQISLAKWNESLTVYSLLVRVYNVGTKNLARLCVGVCATSI